MESVNGHNHHRNFVGGFIGGLLGLLGFAYFGAVAMVIGCLIGVILGFWHRELWTALYKIDHDFGTELVDALRDLFYKIPLFILSDIFYEVCRPVRWCKQHPIKFIKFISWNLISILWICFIVLVIRIFDQFFLLPEPLGDLIIFPIAFLSVISLALVILFSSARKETHRDFYNKWLIVVGVGGIGKTRFALRHFSFNILAVATTTLSSLVFCGMLIAWAVAFFCVVILPLSALVSFLRTFWWAGRQRNHWPCAIITLVVTAGTGIFSTPLLTHEVFRWVVALVNGLLCGYTAEYAVVFMSRWYNSSTWYRAYANVPIKRRLVYYANSWAAPLQWLYSLLLVRAQYII